MSVYLRAGKWKINIILGGVRINRNIPVKTRREALSIQKKLKTLYRKTLLGIEDEATPPEKTFGEYADAYLALVKQTLSPRTYDLYHGDYNIHLEKFWRNIPIPGGINNTLILQFQCRQKSSGLSNCTVNKHLALIRKIVYFARDTEEGMILPMLKFPMLDEPKRQHAFFSPEEFESLVRAFSPHPKAHRSFLRVIFGRLTGMRPAELTYLAWPDISFDSKTAKIQGKKGKWEPKNLFERVIPLNDQAMQIVTELYAIRKGPWVFAPGAKPVKCIQKALKTAARNAGIEKNVTPNMLRHTFITHLFMAGADAEAVRQLAGHRSLETTTRYTHSIDDHLRATVEKLEMNCAKVAPKSRH
ncbi:MAG: tyrosine-type recombinase/integrase [Nitrospirae bacterium]|nr:tyrosine-type recombinase/integrase [Nitrospirota bacterium]